MTKPLNKHRLFVARTGGFPPSTHVWFQCHNCVANLQVERSVMEQLLDGRPIVQSEGLIVWAECKGA